MIVPESPNLSWNRNSPSLQTEVIHQFQVGGDNPKVERGSCKTMPSFPFLFNINIPETC